MLVKVTFSDEELAAVDEVRGQLPRATWIRNWCLQAVASVSAGKIVKEATWTRPKL